MAAPQVLTALEEGATELVAKVAADPALAGVAVERDVACDGAAHALLAHDVDASMLVVASRGHGKLKRSCSARPAGRSPSTPSLRSWSSPASGSQVRATAGPTSSARVAALLRRSAPNGSLRSARRRHAAEGGPALPQHGAVAGHRARVDGRDRDAWPDQDRAVAPVPGPSTAEPLQGTVWRANVARIISGSDRFVDGEGVMDWRLFGRLPVVHASGPDVSRSSAERAAGESIWVPRPWSDETR